MTIETKFNIGDEVWFITIRKAYKGVISEKDEKAEFPYAVGLGDDSVFMAKEHEIFKTKEELIESLFS